MLEIAAQPYTYAFDPETTALLVIDMQRDFVEPGGFGAALGNDVSRLAAIVPTVRDLLGWSRARGVRVIHTREGHRPDLADCPPAKRRRGNPKTRIGEAGPMGRLLVDGEPGNDIIPALAPLPGETVIVKPGKGAFWATPLADILRGHGVTHLLVAAAPFAELASLTV
jgi:nicotinamidase-related amidase